MQQAIIHMGATRTKEGYARGLYCAKVSRRYAGTGRAGNTMDRQQVTCKRCLAKLEKTYIILEKN